MASLGETSRPGFVYDQATDTWIPIGIGSHSHTAASIGAIANTLFTAKGDLAVGTGSGTVTNRTVGSDGSLLVADSTQASGLNWTANQVAGKNKIINGNFAINQRNATSTTSAFAFLADRWKTVGFSGTATYSISTIAYGSFTNQTSDKAFRITSSSSSNDFGLQQAMEDVSTLAGQTVTVSFWARTSGSNYGLDLVELLQNFGTSGSANVYSYATTTGVTLTSTWTRFALNVTLPSVAGKTIGANNYLQLRIDPTTTLANGDWIEITHVQLEAGNVATPFATATGNQANELIACQRFYIRFGNDQNYTHIGLGNADSSTKANILVFLPTSMRVAPTTIDYSTLLLQNNGGSAILSVTSLTFSPAAVQGKNMGVAYPTVASGLTQGTNYILAANGTTNGYLAFGAEL